MTGAKVMLTIASVLAIAAASYLPHATAPAVVSKGSAPPIVAKAPTENASVASVEPRMLAQRPARYWTAYQNESLPCEPAVAALHPWKTGTLDIANCQRTEFVVALNEGEGAGTRVETWPPEVRIFIDQHVSRWVEDNKEKRTVRAMTLAAPKYDGIQSCVLILHHSPKRMTPCLGIHQSFDRDP